MSKASDPNQCPQCGAPISSEAPQGLCPKCLLRQLSVATETGGPQAKTPPPGLQDLAAAFPNLEILELIGQGGMGFVFKARQAKLERLVALKILPQSLAADPAFAERFTCEGRLLARLNHPNIVTIHDFGQAKGFFYLLMEFVDGVNLRQAMKAGRFTPAQALAIVPKICEALQFAHGEGVLHRDIKPENILLDTRGRVKIADFGIAKLVGPAKLEPVLRQESANGATAPGEAMPSPTNLTTAGRVLGTPRYMAPEQLERPQDVDHRADIYSLGVVFYEMLTGELPRARFVPPSEKTPVDPRVDELVFRALQKAPENRPQSAEDVKTQVETITNGPVRRDPEAVWIQPSPPEPPRSRRKKMALMVVLGLTLVVLAGMVKLIPLRLKHPRSPNPKSAGGEISEGEISTAGVALTGSKAGERFSRSIVFSRASNGLIGGFTNAWVLGLWSDNSLRPGETLFARVRRKDGPIEPYSCNSLLHVNWKPAGIGTSASLSWYFGGPWGQDFAEPQAEAALAQLRAHVSDKPLNLTNGLPFKLFAVTNGSGQVMEGYVEFARSVPESPQVSSRPAAKAEAIVHVRRFVPFGPQMDYSVKLPQGYVLHATANNGQVLTSFSPDPKPRTHPAVLPDRGDYHSSWSPLFGFVRPASSSDFPDYPAQVQAQRAALQVRLQELVDMGPISVPAGKPFPVFSITNKTGQVYSGFFELVDPSAADPPGHSSRAETTGPLPAADNAELVSRPGEPGPTRVAPPAPTFPRPLTMPPRTLRMPSGAAPRTNSVAFQPATTIDPATGLPLGPGGAARMRVDPATGLLVPASNRISYPRTNVAPNRLGN